MSETVLALKRYSEEGKAVIAGAQSLADTKNHVKADPIHILCYLLDKPEVIEMFRAMKVKSEELVVKAFAALDVQKTRTSGACTISDETINLIAHLETLVKEPNKVSVESIIEGLILHPKGATQTVFKSLNIGASAIKLLHKASLHTTDLIKAAKQGKFDPVVGRDKEVRRLFQILGRRTKNNPILIGDQGVGKSAIINALATRIANEDAPSNLMSLGMMELELSSVMSGGKQRGEVDERLKAVIHNLPDNTILVISGIESLFTSSGISGTSDILKHVMASPKRNIRLLATTTVEGSKKVADKDPGLMNEFSQVLIDPTSPDLAKEIIRSVAVRYEDHHAVSIGENAIAASVRLAKRYLQDRALPGSAIDLLDEAASRKRLEMESVPANIDDVVRRLHSLRLQRDKLMDKKTGLVRSEFETDGSSTKALKGIVAEIAKLESELEAMESGLASGVSAEVAVSELRTECAEIAGRLAKAEVLKETSKTRELANELSVLKVRLANAEKAAEAAVKAEPVSDVVSEENVARVLEDWTGIPASRIGQNEMERLSKIEDEMRKHVVGQDEAVSAIAQAVRRGRMGLRDPNRPIGSFLFLGSSGVGKTLVAKEMARLLYDDPKAMTRLDMAEYKEQHQAQKLIGSPTGYVGSEGGGILVNAVLRRPGQIILADEIEKANLAVADLFLGILEDSILTSGTGETANFNDTFIIMTSNIGTKRLLETDPKTFDTEEGRKALADMLIHEELKNALRPEFINRIDNIIVFRPLLKDTLMQVADIELRGLNRLLDPHELTLNVSEAAKRALVDDEFDPAFGARPLRRSITRNLQNRLTNELLSGAYKAGDLVGVDYVDGKFSFGKIAA